MCKLKLSIKIKPEELPKGHDFQPWIKHIVLIDDEQLKKTDDITLGFYHCTKCDIYQPYTYKIPPVSENTVVKKAHNDWVDFQLEHAHGDGRVALFERKM